MFYDCSALTEIDIADSVKTIGERAFGNCISLADITLSNSLENLGNEAFFGCTGLTSIIFDKHVKNIGKQAFAKCINLQAIYCKANVPPTFYCTEEIIDRTPCYFYDSPFPMGHYIIYVPKKSIDDYKEKWSEYSDKIRGYDFDK